MDQRSRIVNELMKLAAESGKPMSETEAIARVNDKFCSEIFSYLPSAPDVNPPKIEEKIEEMITDWLGTKD